MANKDRLPPIHPGEILREEFLSPLGMPADQLAMALRVPATRINDIVNEKRGITADTALRLARYFGTTSRFWMNMQTSWELDVAEDQLGESARRDVLPRTARRMPVQSFSTQLIADLALSRAHFGARMERHGPIRLMPL